MPTVRFLQSAALLNSNQVFGHNDELVIEDARAMASLSKQGIVDVLMEDLEDNATVKPVAPELLAEEVEVKKSSKRKKTAVDKDDSK